MAPTLVQNPVLSWVVPPAVWLNDGVVVLRIARGCYQFNIVVAIEDFRALAYSDGSPPMHAGVKAEAESLIQPRHRVVRRGTGGAVSRMGPRALKCQQYSTTSI